MAWTIWKLPEAIFPELGISSNFNSYFSFPEESLKFKAQSQLISFRFKNLNVIIFLWPQRTFPKSTIPSGFESIWISGTVRLLTNSNLYLAPFLTSNTTEECNFPYLEFFLVAKVTVIAIYSVGPSLLFSGVIL